MIFIKKKEEPEAFSDWKKNNPCETSFHALTREAKESLQLSLLDEQGGVCCFCGDSFKSITPDGNSRLLPGKRPGPNAARVAHVISQYSDKCLVFDYTNLCLSCSSDNGKPTRDYWHCDKSQQNKPIPITPLEEDCLSYFFFDEDGKISANIAKKYSDQKKANQTIEILNLNVRSLQTRRRSAIRAFWDVLVEGKVTKEELIQRASSRENNQFTPFYFVIISQLSK